MTVVLHRLREQVTRSAGQEDRRSDQVDRLVNEIVHDVCDETNYEHDPADDVQSFVHNAFL